MSLICSQCGKIIVLSETPDHYGICAACPIPKEESITDEKPKFGKV